MAGNVREVAVRWRDELLFDGGPPSRPVILVDGAGAAATSPVELLLLAAATCSASDVVLILQKQRVALRALEVAVQGTRRETEPRRYTAIHFRFAIAGEGADEAKARRAIDLSLEKYCSVVASLAPDTRITYDVVLH
ncbi:MAG TPA: OsmC family protein [Gemmatimonadales bacterium]|nr:OsmC family protein [Gemmatimonadales bacterium]